ncbi:MAG: LPXTG cell wall anchor domain-containing protein [Acidobacteria bacterium]|nr:LPXTG cell wall anchor domain-containing protein [Acidobacteriota bacterium]
MDNTVLSVILWVGAAAVLVLLIMRRRKRKLQS